MMMAELEVSTRIENGNENAFQRKVVKRNHNKNGMISTTYIIMRKDKIKAAIRTLFPSNSSPLQSSFFIIIQHLIVFAVSSFSPKFQGATN